MTVPIGTECMESGRKLHYRPEMIVYEGCVTNHILCNIDGMRLRVAGEGQTHATV